MCGPPPHRHPLCVDLLRTCTLHVWTYSTHAPSMCGRTPLMHPLCGDYLYTRPFFVPFHHRCWHEIRTFSRAHRKLSTTSMTRRCSSQRVGAHSGQRAPTKARHPVLEPMHCRYVFCFCSDTVGRKVLVSPLRSTPKRTESLGTKGLPMCHTRTHYHTATSSGCGVRSHSSFHGSESPNPSHNSCSNSSTNCVAFQQTNLGILLLRQAMPPFCSQHYASNKHNSSRSRHL